MPGQPRSVVASFNFFPITISPSIAAESVTLSFGKAEFDYRPTKPDSSLGTEKSFKWDVIAVKPL